MSRAGNDFNFLVAQQLQEMGFPYDQARVMAPLVGQYVSGGMTIGDALQLITSDLEVQGPVPAPQQYVGGSVAPVQNPADQSQRDPAGNYLALVRSQDFKGEVTAFSALGHEKSLPLQHLISKLSAESFREGSQQAEIGSVDYKAFLAKSADRVKILIDPNDDSYESGFLDGFNGCGFLPWEGAVKNVFLKSAALYQQALLEIDTTDLDEDELADIRSAKQSFAGFVASVAAAGDLPEYTRVGFEQLVAQGRTENIYKQVKDIASSLLANAYRVGNEGLFDEVLGIIKGQVEVMPDSLISPDQKLKLFKKGLVIEYFKALIEERKSFSSGAELDNFSAIAADIGLIERIGKKFGQDGVEVAKEVMKKSIDKQVVAKNITDAQARDLFIKIDTRFPLVAVTATPESPTDSPTQLQSVRDVFCSKVNIVTGPGIERMIAALCDLPCVNNARVNGKTIFDKDSRVYSADGQSAFAVIVIPFATEHAHWKVVVLRGIKGEDGKFNYQACEIDTDGISRPIDINLLGILQRVALPEASVENQVIAKEVAFDHQLQYNQNCSSAIAMMTSALKDQAIEGKTLNLDKFLTAENKAFLDRGKAAQSIVMQRSMTYDQMMSEGVFTIIDSCDKMLREAVFEKMKSLPLSADCWADTCIEGLGVEGRESLDFSGVNLAGAFITDREAPTDFPSYALPGFPGQGQVAAIQYDGVVPDEKFFRDKEFKTGRDSLPGEAVSLSKDGKIVSYSVKKGLLDYLF